MITMHDSNILQRQVLRCQKPAVVLFTASWSGTGQTIDPLIKCIEKEHEDRIAFYRLYAEDDLSIDRLFGVYMLPTVVLYCDGMPIEYLVGMNDMMRLRDLLCEISANDQAPA